MSDSGKKARGFATLDKELQKKIASLGGRAAHAKGTAHEWTAEEAKAAGRKGGQSIARNREHMSLIGRRGGQAKSRRKQQSGQSDA